MAAKKYYAVKKGRETGIFCDWDSCKAAVEGYSGAEYKGFVRRDDAEEYLGKKAGGRHEEISGKRIPPNQASGVEKSVFGNRTKGAGRKKKESESGRKAGRRKVRSEGGQSKLLRSTGDIKKEKTAGQTGKQDEAEAEPARALPEDCPAEGTLLAYVDGSYDHSLRKYAFGCVFILPDGRIKTKFGNGDNAQSLQQRNVTGEMLGAMYAVRVAMVSGFSKIEIRYDYEGIEKWVTGAWQSRTELTGKYAQAMRKWGENITICFTKVAAHSNVYYNEMADRTAKAGLREGDGVPKVRHVDEL